MGFVNSEMPCGECGAPMKWAGFTAGWMCPVCGPGSHAAQTPTGEVRKAVENTVDPESIVGPIGMPLWTVTAHSKRPGVADFRETLHVRAACYDGAILLTQEMVLDFTFADASQVTS